MADGSWGSINTVGSYDTAQDGRHAIGIEEAVPEGRSFIFVAQLCADSVFADLANKSIHYEITASPAQSGTFLVEPVLVDKDANVTCTIGSGSYIESFPTGRDSETVIPGSGSAYFLGLRITFSQVYAGGILYFDNIRIQ